MTSNVVWEVIKIKYIRRREKMHFTTRLSILFITFLFLQTSFAQNRINYNSQQLFLSGANLAWVSFANDIGTGNPDTTGFTDVLTAMNSSGGNAMRWWLHTDGTVSPEFNTSDSVIGPGVNTISDIRKVLNIAWQREIGVILCLWSFDMMKTDKPAQVQTRNALLLNDTNYTRAYINNCLIPMVDSLKDHPAIIAWEIFNEPEGMSTEFGTGWGTTQVPMSTISRFVNLCAAAIHRADTTAKVTNGAWSFYSLVDKPILAKIVASAQTLTYAEKIQDAKVLIQKNRLFTTPEAIVGGMKKIAGYAAQRNFYSDSMLIAQGGDSAGVLDFYSVHFYGSGTSTSPFHHSSSYWNLTKPIVVAEFAMEAGQGAPTGVPVASIYTRLYDYGYAGALGWSWSNEQISSQAHMLAGMLSMWNSHQSDVNVNGISGAWPAVAIASPARFAIFLDTTAITITAGVSDIDSPVDSVEFYAADTIKIGVDITPPYSIMWQNVPSGNYNLTAVATDHQGHSRTSIKVPITVGLPTTVRLEAELATRTTGSVVTDATASGGSYVNVASSTGTITWHFTNVLAAGTYPITFGYRLNSGTPKNQYININSVRTDTLYCTDPVSTTTWYERTINVDLAQGADTVQMEMWWGWMAVDYLAVPRSVVTSVENPPSMPVNFSLAQNYPNPFNPTTNIKYSLMHSGLVKLIVYDILGRQIATLINERQNAGTYDVPFNASALTSGVYFYRITAGSFSQTRKMVVLK
jgi:hypothetical protein